MRHRWIDESSAPLFVLTYPAVREMGDMYAVLDAAEAIYRRTVGPIAWVVDGTQVTNATVRERSIIAAYEKRVGPLAEHRCAGVGLVIPNNVVRGLYTAIRWVAPEVYPTAIFEHRAPALQWAQGQLAEALLQKAPRTSK